MRTGGFIFFSVLAMLSLLALGIVNAKEKVTIGAIEEVILLPWGVRLPARIDTGASTTSLDARGLKIQNNIAEFRLPDMYGGLLLSLPVVDWRHIRS
ncbi:MAG: RimK/LysX family protein, partial [Proteobacteria bacterium]|nr:RimK/LysX family protein [Pseudomonadota bacterium]